MAELKLNKIETTVEVSIKENGAEWTKILEATKKQQYENLEIKGFRKGNVPANIAEKHISQEKVRFDAVNSLIEANYEEAMNLLTTEKIATRPTIDVRLLTDESVEAVLISHLMPEVKLGDRSSISVEYKVDEVTQEEIDQEVAQLDELLKGPQEVATTEPVEDGDVANIDFLGKVDGVAFEGGEAKAFDLKLGSKQFINGFEEQVVGMKVGETKDIEVTFPEAYPQAELAGKPSVFTVTLNAIKRMVDLEGAELEAKLATFGFKSKDEIVNRIKEVATNQKVDAANDNYFRAYVDAVVALEGTEILVADAIVDQEVEAEFKRFSAQIAQQGMTMDKYMEMLGMTVEEFKEKNLKESSKKRVHDGLVYAKLIEELGIKAEDADVEKEYEKIAEDSKTTVEKVKETIQRNSIESNVIFRKLVENLK